MAEPLAVVPAYLRTEADEALLATCLRTLKETAPSLPVLVVDDCGPLAVHVVDESVNVVHRQENGGFSAAVNVGLERACDEHRSAILINSDIEFTNDRWLPALTCTGSGIAGALLLYPNGTVQHAGVYFSLLSRSFDHRMRHAPGDLPAAHEARECPVTAALQYIDLEVLETIGLYDPLYPLAFEDVDYCLRAWKKGFQVTYEPRAEAVHHEGATRGDGTFSEREAASWKRLVEKWGKTDFTNFVPEW